MIRQGGIEVHNFDNKVQVRINDKESELYMSINLTIENTKELIEALKIAIKRAEKVN